jgi:hypothetical protein
MVGHVHLTTTMRYAHHRPGADDATPRGRVRWRTRTPTPTPKAGDERNSEQLSHTETAEESQAATYAAAVEEIARARLKVAQGVADASGSSHHEEEI